MQTVSSYCGCVVFVAKHAQPDIDLAIAMYFLYSRVDRSTEQDWDNLWRLLHYLKGTIELEKTVIMNGTKEMWTWVDASYGVHNDVRGHTGGVINTKSSMELEIVGASDYLPHAV